MTDGLLTPLIEDAQAAALTEAKKALLGGRLRDLDILLTVVGSELQSRDRYLSLLKDLCQKHPSEVLPDAAEWVARKIEAAQPGIRRPRAADESQDAALDYICLCLLAASDAASEGERSVHALETIKRMARDLFKLELVGRPGEIVPYDESQHELTAKIEPQPDRVEILRPAIRWTDGVRSRILVHAVVKAAT